MASVDISEYKFEFIRDIINSPKIISAIDSKSPKYEPDAADSLIYNNIFPYLRVPDIQTIADTYVLFAVDMIDVSWKNPLFCNMRITVWVMAHQDRMKMDGHLGTRIDHLGGLIKGLFNGKMKYGLKPLVVVSDIEKILNEKYQYREIVFKTSDLSSQVC